MIDARFSRIKCVTCIFSYVLLVTRHCEKNVSRWAGRAERRRCEKTQGKREMKRGRVETGLGRRTKVFVTRAENISHAVGAAR